MAFLDNSGDIILDAVLTDTGRYRLAKGDGSFRITKFALSDDEINYKLYDKTNPSGSAYYDLEIMQTPIFEAFTNNTSTMQHKLLSIPRTNLLYLPVLEVNNVNSNTVNLPVNGGFAVAVTTETITDGTTTFIDMTTAKGIWNGELGGLPNYIRLDQGLDTDEISFLYTLDQDLMETQYIIEIDSRLGMVSKYNDGAVNATISFIDDDNIASYYLSKDSDSGFVFNPKSAFSTDWNNAVSTGNFPSGWVIQGPIGTTLLFQIKSTLELISSDFLFDQLGGSFLGNDPVAASWGITGATVANTFKFIDTIVKVTGATTGYRLDIPVRFLKRTS